jgi:hypothetical protein
MRKRPNWVQWRRLGFVDTPDCHPQTAGRQVRNPAPRLWVTDSDLRQQLDYPPTGNYAVILTVIVIFLVVTFGISGLVFEFIMGVEFEILLFGFQ